MTPKPTAFLWINKDALSKSLSNSKGDQSEKGKIHQHIQARRGSRSTRTIPYRHRMLIQESIEPPKSTPPHLIVSPIQPERGYILSLEEEQDEEKDDTTQLKQGWSDCLQTELVPTGGSLDPFSSFPVEVSPEALRQLWYFEKIWVPAAFRSPSNSDTEQSTNTMEIAEVVHTSLTDDLHMNSLLAAVAMRMQTVHETGSPNGRATAAVYATRAMHALRRLLKNKVPLTERHNMDILFLAAYEMYCFNPKGTQAHLRAFKAIQSGPLGNAYVQKLGQNIDLFTAAASLCAPILVPQQKEITPAKSPRKVPAGLILMDQSMGSAFFSHHKLFGPKILEVIQDIIACGQAAEAYRQQLWIPKRQDQRVADQSFPRIVDWSEKVAYRLLWEMPHQSQHAPKDSPIIVRECSCIALLMWLSYLPVGMMSSTEQQYSQDYRKMVPGRGTGLVNRLESLRILETKQGKPDLELLLWILAVGIVCSVDPDDVEFCAQTFMRIARNLQITTYEELSEILSRYLWLDKFDLVDYDVMANLLNPKTKENAFETVVSWASVTKHIQGEKTSLTRVTNRPSNWYRLGA